MKSINIIKGLLYGVAVGDALGVPVEFKRREELKKNPVTGMRGYGTWHQSPGTWSDDSSLTFCLAESLADDYNLSAIADNFLRWHNDNHLTAHGEVFDIGRTTLIALQRLKRGVDPEMAGEDGEYSNGNGSLMRILPLILHTRKQTSGERFRIAKQVSSITHRHIRSIIACFYYLEFARLILEGNDKFDIYSALRHDFPVMLNEMHIDQSETVCFERLLSGDIYDLPEEKIRSSGYVVHTLEASVWCLMTTGCFHDAVLKAVNLGDDSDTTGAVAGGLAGLLYGFDAISPEWIETLAKRDEIEILAKRLCDRYTDV